MKRLLMPALPARIGWTVIAVAMGILLTALLARDALAQETTQVEPFELVGTVSDDAGRPLVGAFVSFVDSKWGSLTSETGRFLLPDVTPGTVSLKVEIIGYRTQTWTGDVAPGEALAIRMAAEPIVLEGLNVVTDRFETRRKATPTSVRWFDRQALATSPQDNALDFLLSRAGLTKVSCRSTWVSDCFRVRGRTTAPVVWVDEAPVLGGIDYLKVIPPHELYMVEVYGSGRQIRAYTNHFMERAAKDRLLPMAFVF